jgi:hypothetical protein
MGSKPGSHLPRSRTRPGGPSRVARPLAFRQAVYIRMEEVSFRTSMTVLAGVVAFAAVVASVSTLMSLSPGPAQRAALSRPPVSAVPSSIPATPARAAPAPPSASSSQPSASPSPVRGTGSGSGTHPPVTTAGAASAPSPRVPAPAPSPRVPAPSRVPVQAAAAAWWSRWLRVYGGGGFHGSGPGSGGFGRGGGFGRR